MRGIWRAALERFAEGEEPVDGEAVLELAVEHGLSAYDAQYAALAQRLGVELVTEDRRLLRALPAVAISMREFLGAGA
jgi:predicted nucleic acid-binding protein